MTPLEILRRDGWCKDIWRNERGEHCLMGAFIAAYNNDQVEEWDGTKWPMYDEVIEVVREQFSDRAVRPAAEIAFNNHPDTTFADVAMVLEKAQLRYDESLAASPVSGVSVDATTTPSSA